MGWLHFPKNQTISLALAGLALCLSGAAQPTYEKLCQQGRKHLLSGEHKEAEDAYAQAVQLDPERPLAHVGQALAFRAAKQYDQAVKAATRAIGTGAPDEDDVAALVIRGTAHHAQKQYDLAKIDLEAALKLAPRDACAHAELGRVFVALKDEMQALFHFSNALEADREDHQTYVARGKLYRQQGNLGKAGDDFEKAIRLHPGSAAYHFLLGQVRFENREYDSAVRAAEKAIDLKEDFAAAYVLNGASFYHQGEYEKAEAALTKAVEMARMDAGAWLWLGKTRLAQEKVEQATKDIRQALDIDGEYIAAQQALADAYDKAERSEEAAELRGKAYDLEKTLRKVALFGPEFLNDVGPSRLGLTKGFDASTIAGQTLDSRVPSAEMITQQVRSAAEQRRQQLIPWQRDLEICEAASVVPQACESAERNYRKSVDLFEAGDYEVAAYGFGQVEALYQAALEQFDKVASKDYMLWLDWARQRAEGNLSSNSRAKTLLVLAEASHRAGDEEGYRRFSKQAVSYITATGIVNPKYAVNALLDTAELQLRCGDRSGAKESAVEAANFCDGIQEPAPKSFRMARCAGILARLGETHDWTRLMPIALGAARQVGDPVASIRARWPILVQCVAYAEAYSAERALAAAESLGPAHRNRDHLAKRTTLAYAATAFAAATASRDEEAPTATFTRSYATACTHLATLLLMHTSDANFTRRWLALADVRVGQCDRAWVSALNIPDPELRGQLMGRILSARVDRGKTEDVIAADEYLPKGVCAREALCRIAEARALSGKWTTVQLKKWAEGEPGADAKCVALCGIALGVKAGLNRDLTDRRFERLSHNAAPQAAVDLSTERAAESTEQQEHATAAVSEELDAKDAVSARWWLEQAVIVARSVDDPCLRAQAWLQVARARRQTKDSQACRAALDEAIHCTTAVWNEILARRPVARREYDDAYRWRLDHRTEQAELAEVNSLLGVLLDAEQSEYEIGDSRAALDTLLLGLRCTEPMPREGGYASPAGSQVTWLARIAGRARLRGRADIAEIIISRSPWRQVQAVRGTTNFVRGLAAAEAQDVNELTKWAELLRTNARYSSELATYSAILHTRIALLAASKGDEDGYRKAAMTVGGLINASRYPASQSVFLQLAEATAVLGQPDVAREYVEQSRVYGPERDAVLAQIAIALVKEGRLADARKTLDGIRDEGAKVPARYAIARTEAGGDAVNLLAVFQDIEALPSHAEKAAALAGVGAALLSK